MGFDNQETLSTSDLCVYLHKRKDDGIVFYVGIGKKARPKSLSGRNIHWKNTVTKHGYIIELLHTGLNREEAIKKEIELIAFYRDVCGTILTNQSTGGDGAAGCYISPETRLKMRKSQLGKVQPLQVIEKIKAANTGKKRTEETKQRMSQARQGILVHTEESRRKISNAKKGKSIHTEESKKKIALAVAARDVSLETKSKISEANKGKKRSLETRLKISLAKMGNTNRVGKTRTLEERKKLSIALKGKPWSEARRNALKFKNAIALGA